MIYSRQRELILNELAQNRGHPTAEELYERLHERQPGLSLATVYRNLNQMTQNGMVAKVGVTKGAERFDATVNGHYHMVCEDCGKVVDIPKECVPDFCGNVAKTSGCSIDRYNLLFYGRCQACNK